MRAVSCLCFLTHIALFAQVFPLYFKNQSFTEAVSWFLHMGMFTDVMLAYFFSIVLRVTCRGSPKLFRGSMPKDLSTLPETVEAEVDIQTQSCSYILFCAVSFVE